MISPEKINKDDLYAFIIEALKDDPGLLSVDGKGHPLRSQFKKCICIWDWISFGSAAKENMNKLETQQDK